LYPQSKNCPSVGHWQEVEGYIDVIDEARTALEAEVDKNAELQQKITELNTALEEKDLEVQPQPISLVALATRSCFF
jgi:hypothetical protein